MGTYQGKVVDGKVVFQGAVPLPDGTVVSITPLDELDPIYRIGDDAVDTGITDLAQEHDHYAYGTPKKHARPEK